MRITAAIAQEVVQLDEQIRHYACVVQYKVFNFAGLEWRPDPAFRTEVVIAAASLTSARRCLEEGGFGKPHRHSAYVPSEARTLALANPEVPVWQDVESSAEWHVGGRAVIDEYRRSH